MNAYDPGSHEWHRDLTGARLRESWLLYKDAQKAFQPFISNQKICDAMVRLNQLFDRVNAAFAHQQLDACDAIAPQIEAGLVALRGAAREAGVMPQYCQHMVVPSIDRCAP